MSSPVVDKVLFAYIVVALYAISFVLIWVDSGIQRPVYYVSKSINAAKVRYLPLEKAILVVVHATRKLPHYSRHTPWLFSSNFHSNRYSRVQIILAGLPNEARF